MSRFCWVWPVVVAWATCAGCGGPSPPEPLTADQQRELKQRMEQVQQDERAGLGHETPGDRSGKR